MRSNELTSLKISHASIFFHCFSVGLTAAIRQHATKRIYGLRDPEDKVRPAHASRICISRVHIAHAYRERRIRASVSVCSRRFRQRYRDILAKLEQCWSSKRTPPRSYPKIVAYTSQFPKDEEEPKSCSKQYTGSFAR